MLCSLWFGVYWMGFHGRVLTAGLQNNGSCQGSRASLSNGLIRGDR